MIHFADIPYGFEFGSATVIRQMSDEKKGWVIMNVKTSRADIQIYVTKTGKGQAVGGDRKAVGAVCGGNAKGPAKANRESDRILAEPVQKGIFYDLAIK